MSEEEKTELDDLYENSEWWHNRFNAVQRDYEELKKRNKQLKETIKEATRILNSAKNHYGNDGKNLALERAIRIFGDKENEI